MKIRNITISFAIAVSACMTLSLAMHAETVSRKEAGLIAQAFFNAAYGEVTPEPKLVWNGRQLTTARLFPPFHVFNHQRGGYVVVSAENKAFPILAYSLKRNFKREELTDEETDLLKTYAREIELIRYDSRIPERAFAAWRNIPGYITDILTRPYSTPEYEALDDEDKERLEHIDRTGKQIMLPGAVEFNLYDPDDYRDMTLDDVTEEVPFEFYDNFIRSIRKEAATRAIEFDELISPTKPIVKSIGGGHFEITFPESIRMMRIYAMSGMQVMEKYYKETNVMNIDLEALGSGYYVGMALSDKGNVYGFKLYR